MSHQPTAATDRSWNEILAPYKRPVLASSVFQLVTTVLLFVGLWYLMLLSLDVSYWLTLALAVPAAGMSIRLFIIQHDCGHGAYFRSRAVADAVGFVLGVVTLIPYGYWRKTHAIHHAGSGNLDEREFGDVMTKTVDEYLALSAWGRLGYRLYRNPLIMLGIGPVYQFVIKHRLPLDIPFSWKREWASVLWTNLALAGILGGMAWTIGLERFFWVQAPITVISGSVGVWLFYVQHQFEDTYWGREEDWDFHRAGIEGSSFLTLSPLMHWFTGNIGFHHVHHLSSRIPNYLLRRCHEENPELHVAKSLSVWEGIKALRLKLWDEERNELISWKGLRARSASAAGAAGGPQTAAQRATQPS